MKNSVTQADIDLLLEEAIVSVTTIYDKCTVVSMQLKNGFVLTESSACVSPSNYSQEMGKDICIGKIKDKLWELEGYALQKKLHEEAQQ